MLHFLSLPLYKSPKTESTSLNSIDDNDNNNNTPLELELTDSNYPMNQMLANNNELVIRKTLLSYLLWLCRPFN